jgi:hypothetical protein
MNHIIIQFLCILVIISSVFSFQQKFTAPFIIKLRIPDKNNFSLQCQSNEFEKMETEITEKETIENKKNKFDELQIKNEYEILLNRCCGEVNEKDELEELEREFFEIYQKMKKYNKKRFIQTKQDIYKLLRRFN